MRDELIYEWCCEYVDAHGDIQDLIRGENKLDVWPGDLDCEHKPRLCIIRLTGNNDDDETSRGYAYVGDSKFSNGYKIPKILNSQLRN